jgi:flagellum-specific peptidoglycan hydrolase FlgJ
MKKVMLLLSVVFLFAFSSPNNKFSYENFVTYCINKGIKYTDIVIAQSKLETGNFKSRIFKLNNNLFGMRLPEHRETTAKGSKHGYAYYDSWQASVDDYALYQQSLEKKIKSRTAYISYIKRTYSTSPTYIKKVLHIAKYIDTTINKTIEDSTQVINENLNG